jgi:addiction module HigA family antidote
MLPNHRAPTHPGELLLKEFLEPLGLGPERAAALMGLPLGVLTEIIDGTRAVTGDTALLFATLTGTTSEFWLQLQMAVDLYRRPDHVD